MKMNSEVKKKSIANDTIGPQRKTSFGENSVNINVAPLNFIG